MYEKFIAELRSYSKAIRILSKGYLPITLITPSKIRSNFKASANSYCKNKPRL